MFGLSVDLDFTYINDDVIGASEFDVATIWKISDTIFKTLFDLFLAAHEWCTRILLAPLWRSTSRSTVIRVSNLVLQNLHWISIFEIVSFTVFDLGFLLTFVFDHVHELGVYVFLERLSRRSFDITVIWSLTLSSSAIILTAVVYLLYPDVVASLLRVSVCMFCIRLLCKSCFFHSVLCSVVTCFIL